MRSLTAPISARFAALIAFFLIGAVPGPPVTAAEDACAGFAWDVTRERALVAGDAAQLPAGTDSSSAPLLAPGRLYALQLRPIDQVHFVTTPGRRNPSDGGYAGVAALKIPAPGTYRIAVDAPFWVDVVADGGLMNVKDFQSAHDCDAPRKILEFEFPMPRQVTLQFSGAAHAGIRLSITAAGP
jgi:hypothetical protein